MWWNFSNMLSVKLGFYFSKGRPGGGCDRCREEGPQGPGDMQASARSLDM